MSMSFLEALIRKRFPHAQRVERLSYADRWRVVVDFDERDLVAARAGGHAELARNIIDRVEPKAPQPKRRLHWRRKWTAR